MGAGAYSVTFDYGGGTGGTGPLQRVIPLPPPEGAGAVKFTNVFLSLAYDNFDPVTKQTDWPATFPATIRVLKSGAPPVTTNFTVEVGRTLVVGSGPGGSFQPGDLAVSVTLFPPTVPNTQFRPSVTALVEYTTP